MKSIFYFLLCCLMLAGCIQRRGEGDDRLFPDFSISEDRFENFTICYQDMRHSRLTERGYIGNIGDKKFFFESWAIPNIRGMKLKFMFIRTDTSTLKDYDFCLQELPVSQGFSQEFILVSKEKNNYFKPDTTLTLDKLPGFVQPLFTYLNGWQRLRHINRGETDDPKMYIKGNQLFLEYINLDANDNKTPVRREYEFDGEKFIATNEPEDAMPDIFSDTINNE